MSEQVSQTRESTPTGQQKSRKGKAGYWSKTTFNFWLDATLLVIFSVLIFTSVVVRFVFPPAAESAGWQLWGLDHASWIHTQFVVLCVLAAAVLLHVMLHWTWVIGVVYTKILGSKSGQVDNGLKTIYGVGLMIVLLNIVGLAIAAAALMIQKPPV